MNGKSIKDRGTLTQLKSFFNHRNASKDVFNSFNHTEDLFRFSTEAHIIRLTMDILNLESFDDSPQSNEPGSHKKDSKADRQNFLFSTAMKVLDVIRLLPSKEEVAKMLEAESTSDVLCTCTKGI